MTAEHDEIVTIEDARKAGYCVKGIRDWAKLRGIDFRSLVKHGMKASELEKTDEIGRSVVEAKRKRVK